jgi:hypothetical protein
MQCSDSLEVCRTAVNELHLLNILCTGNESFCGFERHFLSVGKLRWAPGWTLPVLFNLYAVACLLLPPTFTNFVIVHPFPATVASEAVYFSIFHLYLF